MSVPIPAAVRALALPADWLPLGPVWVAAVSGTVATQKTYAKILSAFARGVDAAPAGVTRLHLIAYKAHMVGKGLSGRTIRHRLIVLGSFFDWLIGEGLHPGPNPAAGIPLPRVGGEPVGRALSFSEMERLDRACLNARDRALIWLLVSNLRAKEAIGLEQRDLNFTESGAIAVVRNGKGGKSRQVPIEYRAAEALVEYVSAQGAQGAPSRLVATRSPLLQRTDGSGKALTYSNVYRIVVAAGQRAGLGHLTPHDLRRTAITEELWRLPLPIVQKRAGHATGEQTWRYFREPGDGKPNLHEENRGFPSYPQRDAE